MTTKLVEHMATHSRLYRLATQATSTPTNDVTRESKSRHSPQKRPKKEQHRRNKSDTDLSWYLGTSSVQKNVANSKFYTQQTVESVLLDPEAKLLNAFFSASDLYKAECLNEEALESEFFLI